MKVIYLKTRSLKLKSVIIEKLKYSNLEINTSKIINTKENINIRRKMNQKNRRHSVCESMEIVDIDNEIKHYEIKLKKASDEYNSSMICEWSKIKEKEVYFLREIQRAKEVKKRKRVKH